MRAAQFFQFPGDPTEAAACLPRSGYTQQPGVAAQWRTPGHESRNPNAEGVLQPLAPPPCLTPTRIVHPTQCRTFGTNAEIHPETTPSDDDRVDFGCIPSARRRVTGLRRMRHSRSAIETRLTSVVDPSPTSMIRVLNHEPCRRSNASSKTDTGCGHDLQHRRSGWTVSPGFDTRLPDSHAGHFEKARPSKTAYVISSKTRCADRPARETGPCLSHFVCGNANRNGCRTPSAFNWLDLNNLGCAAARRPQANGCNRFAVVMLARAACVNCRGPRTSFADSVTINSGGGTRA